MAGPLDTYNADVLAKVCERCDAQLGQRCRGKGIYGRATSAHKVRIEAAGYRWDQALRELIKVTPDQGT